MKNLIILFISSLLIAAPSTFNVEGMKCGVGCVNKIKAQVGTLQGVTSCDVDFEKGIMVIDYDQSKLNDTQIIKLLTNETTYKVSSAAEKVNTPSKSCATKCSSSCCGAKKGKVGFFKRISNWF